MRFVLLALLVGCKDSPRTYTLDELPIAEWTSGLPVSGDGKLVTDLPEHIDDWTKAKGYAEFTCDGCSLGDGKTQMQIDFWGETGVDFGQVNFVLLRARVDFGAGGMRLRTQWTSLDFILDADVRGTLAPRAKDIRIDGCVVFAPTDALLHRDPKMHALISTTGAPLRDDHMFTIRLAGTVGQMKRLGQLCSIPR